MIGDTKWKKSICQVFFASLLWCVINWKKRCITNLSVYYLCLKMCEDWGQPNVKSKITAFELYTKFCKHDRNNTQNIFTLCCLLLAREITYGPYTVVMSPFPLDSFSTPEIRRCLEIILSLMGKCPSYCCSKSFELSLDTVLSLPESLPSGPLSESGHRSHSTVHSSSAV